MIMVGRIGRTRLGFWGSNYCIRIRSGLGDQVRVSVRVRVGGGVVGGVRVGVESVLGLGSGSGLGFREGRRKWPSSSMMLLYQLPWVTDNRQ